MHKSVPKKSNGPQHYIPLYDFVWFHSLFLCDMDNVNKRYERENDHIDWHYVRNKSRLTITGIVFSLLDNSQPTVTPT